ncbi:hypothetical protein CRYUN_Cryun32bG0102300 [Craigia yunnanensis]
MNAADAASATTTTTLLSSSFYKRSNKANGESNDVNVIANKKIGVHGNAGVYHGKVSFMKWTLDDVVYVARYHRIPCVFAAGLLFFMYVEYTLRMVPDSSPPFDLGFVVTRSFHRSLASWPELNTLLAALNTVFVGMQSVYIIGTWLIEGRPRASIAALFMFTCRGILGYSTQLPLPQVNSSHFPSFFFIFWIIKKKLFKI